MHIEFLDAGDVIKIEGPPADADKAHEILENQAKDLMSAMEFVEINVDAKYHKHIIGKGGSTGKLKTEIIFKPNGTINSLEDFFRESLGSQRCQINLLFWSCGFSINEFSL